MAIKRFFAVLAFLCGATAAFAQVEEAREAIERGEYPRAVTILSEALANRPAPDVYRYLGVAYRNMREYERAEEVLREGSERYPKDERFHDQLADVYLANNDVERAKAELSRALEINPNDAYAADLLATIDISEGRVQSALRSWNKAGKPIVRDVLNNSYLNMSWIVRESVAFKRSGVLHYSDWKTTEMRLWETGNFSNIGLEIEPAAVPDHYDAVIRTSAKTNSRSDFVFGILQGAAIKTSYFDWWNAGNSGVNFNSSYRWETGRRRADAGFKIPLPLPGILHLEIGATWRSERWDLSPAIRPESRNRARFHYKSDAARLRLRHIPHYRVQLGAGFEYLNRYATGDLPELATNTQNTGRLLADVTLRLADSRYRNLLRIEGFASRRSILGDMNYTAGTAELNNRWEIAPATGTYFDWAVKAGTSRGKLPVEDYFVLGTDVRPSNLLRGHAAHEDGYYGRAPMGTDFVLANLDIERRILTLPLFNTLNIPFLNVKWEIFFDAAKTWDRHRIFQQGKLWLDTGAGLKFETPASSFTVVYGRSVRDGTDTLMGYVERRLW